MSSRAPQLISRKVFISYSRSDEARVKELAKDIEELGHAAWIDQQLAGGQSWWERILLEIRNCDVFVFALSATAVDSRACLSEYAYGRALGKPILPVMVSEDLSDGLMPRELGELHRVDYTKQDKAAFAGLNRALGSMPAAPPLPVQLPPSPEVPASYLFDLKTEIDALGVMTPEHQKKLLDQIKTRVESGHARSDVLELLSRFRNRDDVVVRIYRELDEIAERIANEQDGNAQVSKRQSTGAGAAKAHPALGKQQPSKAAVSRSNGAKRPKVAQENAIDSEAPDFASIVREIVRRRVPATDLHVEPNIPFIKLANARTSCAVPSSEEIVALVDMTVLGSANDALLFGRQALYHHNPASVPNIIKIPYEALARDEFTATGGAFAPCISFASGLRMSWAGTSFPLDAGARMLAEIQAHVAEVTGEIPPDLRSTSTRLTPPDSDAEAPDVGDLIAPILEESGPSADYFVAPEIPANRLAIARQTCCVPEDDEILALIDLTFFGSASDALLIGRRRIYYNNEFAAPKNVVISFASFGAQRFSATNDPSPAVRVQGVFQVLGRARQTEVMLFLGRSSFGTVPTAELLKQIRWALIDAGVTEDTADPAS